MNISFVIPCYRSERTIEAVVEELTRELAAHNETDYEIILVNDHSPDGVWNTIKAMSRRNPHVRGISLARNFGQHSALLAGYAHTSGKYVFSLDDDGQAPVDEMYLLLDKIEEGYDVVYAYYSETKQNAFRRFGSWTAQKMDEIMINQPKGFKGSSFYVARRFVIEEMVKYRNPYPYLAGLVFRTTLNVANVETHHRSRVEGTSGYSFGKLLALWINGFTAFSVKPLEAGTILGVLFALFGGITAIVTIIRRILDPGVIMGWTSIIALQLVIGGVIMIMLGLIGEYIGRIYISINNSPQYVIRDKINLE